MKCLLCSAEVESLKKNTHYISSFLIQRCFDQAGANKRGRGSYYDIHPSFVEYRFERDTSPDSIEKNLKRPATDVEIEREFNNHPCSVDDCFCSECERRFCAIEVDYCTSIHNKVVQQNVYSFEKQFNGIFRAFYYMQICRTLLVRGESQSIDPNTFFILKSAVLSYPNVNVIKGFYDLPITVSHLITKGDAKEYTNNNVIDFMAVFCPHVIFMNDFVVQLYDNINHLPFDTLFGVNCMERYKSYLMIGNSDFKFQVISDSKRRSINNKVRNFWAKLYIKSIRKQSL